MKRAIEDEEYVKWMFMLGEYYSGQRLTQCYQSKLGFKAQCLMVVFASASYITNVTKRIVTNIVVKQPVYIDS